MKIGDVGKVGTNLQYRLGTIEYIHEDSLIVRYRDGSMEKIGFDDFIPVGKVKENIAVITSTEFDEAFREALRHSNFAERLKAILFNKSEEIRL